MIANLLFDLGGVIMDIDRSRCVRAFKALGLGNADDYFGEFVQKGPFMLLENGDITPDDFHDIMHRSLPRHITDDAIDAAFCRFLTGIPAHRLADLRNLRRTHRIFLLSNTNPIMWDSFIKTEFEQEGFSREDYFDGIVTSFEANVMKPSPQIFQYACRKFSICPGDTLFVDDSQANLDAAAALGFRTALCPQGSEFIDIVNNLLTECQ